MRLAPFSSARRLSPRLVAGLAVMISFGLDATATWATVGPPIHGGNVVVVEAENRTKAITNAKSATRFTLQLPADAKCPGDSAHDQWRFQTFIVPASVDPGTLDYGVIGPQGKDQFALYGVNTNPVVDSLLQQNQAAGQPGVIPPIDPLSFAVFPPGTLPSGHYRLGVACTLARKTSTYWDTEVVLTATPSDKPGQLIWRLASAPEVQPASNSRSTGWIFAAVGALFVGVLFYFFRRNARSRTKPSKEKS